MSEPTLRLDRLIGDDEWGRQQELDRLQAQDAPPGLARELVALFDMDDPGRRAGARMALSALAAPGSPSAAEALDVLTGALDSEHPDIRVLATSALGESGNAAALPALARALGDEDQNVSASAADALGELRHPGALDPLIAGLLEASSWTMAAMVVALGRLRDPRALPALERAAAAPEAVGAVVEAVRSIGDPAGLPLLERLYLELPGESLEAAGEILASHPDLDPPDWVVAGAVEHEDRLRRRLEEADDAAVARVLGLAGTTSAVEALLAAIRPSRRSDAAIAGLLAVPADVRAAPVLHELEGAEPEDQVVLLSLLPPLHEPDMVERVIPLLKHTRGDVRTAAAEALARSPADESYRALVHELEQEPVAPEVVRATGSLGPRICRALIPLLGDPEPTVRAAAADALGRCADAAVGDTVAHALENETDLAVRRSLLRSLGQIAGGDAVPVLTRALTDEDPETRVVAIEALGATGSADAMPALQAVLDGPRHELLAAIRSLGELGDVQALPVILPFLESADLDRRRAAAGAVGSLAGALEQKVVDSLADDPDPWIRGRAVTMLAERGAASRTTLERLAAADPDPNVRGEARRALVGEA